MNLIERYEQLSVDMLRGWCDDGRGESLHLDFKDARAAGRVAASDSASFAKAVSAFANSDGGLIIWGVDCRTGDDGVDRIRALTPIRNVARFVSRLDELSGDIVVPILPALRHRAIDSADSAGFVVSLVPASDSGPHMAKGGLNQYFKRSGRSSYRMEHFDIADMFGRRRAPLLELHGDCLQEDALRRRRLALTLINVGRGPAVAPHLEIGTPAGFGRSPYGVSDEGYPGFKISTGTSFNSTRWLGDASFVIHPGVELDIVVFHGQLSTQSDISIWYRVGAFDHPISARELIIPVRKGGGTA